MAAGKNPAAVFYWNDWENDPALRVCSLAAQGLWMRCLCIAARAPESGYVEIPGQDCGISNLPRVLARLVGEDANVVIGLVDELLSTGTASVDKKGRVFCRRMVRAAALSQKRAACGAIGAAATNGKKKQKEDLPGGLPDDLPDKLPASSILPASQLHTDPYGSGAIAPRRTRATRLPNDWTPEPAERLFAEQMGLDVDAVVAVFRDYWVGVPGQRGCKLDWPATFRNWCRKERGPPQGRPMARTAPPPDPTAEPWEQRLAAFKRSGFWASNWGGKPGERFCHVPPDILERHGYGRAA